MNKKTAKEIYFDNFGNFMTMKRNGEYRNYVKYKISSEEEYHWSLEIKKLLIDDIVLNGDFLKIAPLSRINLPENEIIESFKTISFQCPNSKIRQTLELLQNLIPPNIYEKIFPLFFEKSKISLNQASEDRQSGDG